MSNRDHAAETSTAMREFYGAITTPGGLGSDAAEAAAINLRTVAAEAAHAGVTNQDILDAHSRTA